MPPTIEQRRLHLDGEENERIPAPRRRYRDVIAPTAMEGSSQPGPIRSVRSGAGAEGPRADRPAMPGGGGSIRPLPVGSPGRPGEPASRPRSAWSRGRSGCRRRRLGCDHRLRPPRQGGDRLGLRGGGALGFLFGPSVGSPATPACSSTRSRRPGCWRGSRRSARWSPRCSPLPGTAAVLVRGRCSGSCSRSPRRPSSRSCRPWPAGPGPGGERLRRDRPLHRLRPRPGARRAAVRRRRTELAMVVDAVTFAAVAVAALELRVRCHPGGLGDGAAQRARDRIAFLFATGPFRWR